MNPILLTHLMRLVLQATILVSVTLQSAPVLNTQREEIPLLSPEQALKSWHVPNGFEVTLFASEPKVRQPIAMAFDERGRLWVVENNTYAENGAYELEFKDRIVIERSSIERIQNSQLSLMPEGQLESLNDEDVRDLIGFLMAPTEKVVSLAE